jgi:hypothetical protein
MFFNQKNTARAWTAQCSIFVLSHIRKPLYGLGKILYRLIYIPVLNAVPDTVLDMALQNDLSNLMESRFGCIDLREHILTGNVLVYHAVDGLNLPDDFFQPAVQIVCVHTLSHNAPASLSAAGGPVKSTAPGNTDKL